jgi:hypothetical protein
MLNQIRNYVIIALLIFASAQTYRVKSAQLETATLQNAINSANHQQLDKLRLREQEAARSAKQSQVHTDEIMKQTVSGGCQGAIDYLIRQSSYLTD